MSAATRRTSGGGKHRVHHIDQAGIGILGEIESRTIDRHVNGKVGRTVVGLHEGVAGGTIIRSAKAVCVGGQVVSRVTTK